MKIHFIGIGGIGVSGLAQYYLAKGHQVSGSDLVASEITKLLKKKGAKIYIGPHKKESLTSGVKQVIYSPAVKKDNPEFLEAKKRKIKIQSYPEALGELTKKYFTIAVCGTHGKSTTTAMTALILVKAGLNPTVIIGTKLKEFNDSNFRMGKGTPYQNKFGAGQEYLVIEADEWNASFLNYWPKIIVLTNIEKEHLDYYKNLKHILKTYQEFINHLPEEGTLIIGGKNKNTKKDIPKLKKVLKVPGEYNILNALAALTTARVLKIPDKISYKALSEYKGAWRRFQEKELRIKNLKLKIISDYAHHPTEIKVTLKAAREKFPDKKIWCIFQPHQYQRTFYLFKDFIKVFRQAPIDKLIITDIYDVAGREKAHIKNKISSEKLVKVINRPWVIYLLKKKIMNYLKQNLKGEEVVIIMGAGDIYKIINH